MNRFVASILTLALLVLASPLVDMNSIALGQETDKRNDRPADRPTDRPNDRPTDRPSDRPTDRPEDREIWKHLVHRLGLTEEQQIFLLQEAAAFKHDVTPFIRQLNECAEALRRLKETDGDPELIRRAENCVLDHLQTISRLFDAFVQNVARILNDDQQHALRGVVKVLLVIFDINLPVL